MSFKPFSDLFCEERMIFLFETNVTDEKDSCICTSCSIRICL